jgi:hypothetical protein
MFESGSNRSDRRAHSVPRDLISSAKHVASQVTPGYVSEDFAVRYLARTEAQYDVAALQAAAIDIKADADALPLAVALLERAIEYARNPPAPRLVRQLPDTRRIDSGNKYD